jgi:hypothetical protein
MRCVKDRTFADSTWRPRRRLGRNANNPPKTPTVATVVRADFLSVLLAIPLAGGAGFFGVCRLPALILFPLAFRTTAVPPKADHVRVMAALT